MKTNRVKRYEEQQIREIDKAASRFSEHLMSNSKWVKLVSKLVENISSISKIEFKKIQSNEIGELTLSEDTEFGFDYWQNGFEGHNSLGGWLTFKEIEYLIFTKHRNKNDSSQNLDEIENIILSVGQFVIEKDKTQLKLLCYR
jgi:hypothetical protein